MGFQKEKKVTFATDKLFSSALLNVYVESLIIPLANKIDLHCRVNKSKIHNQGELCYNMGSISRILAF